jgi:hypothetical protein
MWFVRRTRINRYPLGAKVMKFEVQQTLTGRNTWESVWTEDGKPLTFPNPVQAESELLDHLNACKAAGLEVYAKDFRIKLVVA